MSVGSETLLDLARGPLVEHLVYVFPGSGAVSGVRQGLPGAPDDLVRSQRHLDNGVGPVWVGQSCLVTREAAGDRYWLWQRQPAFRATSSADGCSHESADASSLLTAGFLLILVGIVVIGLWLIRLVSRIQLRQARSAATVIAAVGSNWHPWLGSRLRRPSKVAEFVTPGLPPRGVLRDVLSLSASGKTPDIHCRRLLELTSL